MHNKENQNNSLSDFLFVLFTGVAIGAVASILYKNNEKKINENINRFAEDVKDKSQNAYSNVKSTLQTAGNKIKNASEEIIGGNEEEVSNIQQNAEEIKDDTSDIINNTTSRLKRVLRNK